MPVPSLRISILHYQPAGESADAVVGQIEQALRELGHEPHLVPVDNRISDVLTAIETSKCDLVFNVCETFAEDYRMEVNVAALMELMNIKYTGAGPSGLMLAQDKIIAKQLLEYHQVRTPSYAVLTGDAFEAHGQLQFPLIVKPARTDASLGIGRHSLVKDWDELHKRVRGIRKEFDDEALAEEFIEGREVYVAVLGRPNRAEILPIVELDWGKWNPATPMISDRDVKFGPETEGSPRLVIAKGISDELRTRIERSALLAYRALKLRDYARIDFRICARTGEPYILEANPNPYLEKASELALAAASRGVSYTQLIGRIVESAATRNGLAKRSGTPTSPGIPVVAPLADTPGNSGNGAS